MVERRISGTGGKSRRQHRVSESIRGEIARLLLIEVADPRLSLVTVTGVDVSPDLKHAKVFYVATGSEDQTPAQRGLERATALFQRAIGRNLQLKYTPRLSFHHDPSFNEGEHMEALVGSIRAERAGEETTEERIGRLVADVPKILVATHRNPDGDAIGSMLGLTRMLTLMGKEAHAYCPDGVPEVLRFLPGASDTTGDPARLDEYNLTVVVDTADTDLLPDGFPGAAQRGTLIVIDHHMRHGDLGDVVLRREAGAVGEILFDLHRRLVWPMDAGVACCLYTSIVADTGSFRYASTTPSTHEAAAALIAEGARPWEVATALYESYPLRRQRLLGKVIETLDLSEDARFAQLYATPEMLTEIGANSEDLDGMVNFGRSIDTVEVAALLRLEPSGDIKVSFRSKGRIDIGDLAETLGGGGHTNAAGCTLSGLTIEEARHTISDAAARLLRDHETP
jgi:bifunctional oligoribonuclease and PAP phosphatase NrnA